MTFKEIILNSTYREKINCILPVLDNNNIDSWDKLQNLPGILAGSNFCKVDVYAFVAEMNRLIKEIQEENNE